jgi:hypothetical protein
VTASDDTRAAAGEYARGVRRALFGRDDPPFRSEQEAIAWLRRESAAGDTPERRAAVAALVALAAELFDRVRNQVRRTPAAGFRVGVTEGQALVAFPGAGGWVEHVPATTELLDQLADEAEAIARFAHCFDAVATMAILVGRPVAQSVRHRRGLVANQVGVMSWRGVSGPGASITSGHVKKPRDPLSSKDRDVLRLVQEREAAGRPVPSAPGRQGVRSGVRAYWEDFTSVWNERYPLRKPYRHWTAPRGRYATILEKLQES